MNGLSESNAATLPKSFEEVVETRRQEACQSILVQVHSEQSCSDLHRNCSQYGEVRGMHHYCLPGSLHFVVVEFKHKSDVDHVLSSSRHISKDVIPVRSPFLWFRAPKKGSQSSQEAVVTTTLSGGDQWNTCPSSEELKGLLEAVESLSDQIAMLHRSTLLCDLGVRLRFLTARQIELALGGLFPKVMALPFGSSVNGFGKTACDLDLVLVTDNSEPNDGDDTNCRLVFHAKTSLANGRTQMQRHMETLGDVCQLLLPGCSHVRRILQARVPIIKYHQDLTDVECDLSMTNLSAVHMSELLYILGAVDPRVRPLVFAIRKWAREVGLTNPTPGRWITNFSLTLLVLFYLQQGSAPVLPTLNTMISLAGPGDERVTSDGVNCTFIRDIPRLCKHMASSAVNTDDLETLFAGFFDFYAGFDFNSHAISLISGTMVSKPDHSPLYLANPLERGLNVSKNVSYDETERLKIEFRNASWMLESLPMTASSSGLWGLSALLEAPRAAAKGRNIFYIPSKPHRIMDVSHLFNEDVTKTKDSGNRTKPVRVSRVRRR